MKSGKKLPIKMCLTTIVIMQIAFDKEMQTIISFNKTFMKMWIITTLNFLTIITSTMATIQFISIEMKMAKYSKMIYWIS